MRYKNGLFIICLVICLFTIASVCASDVDDVAQASEDNDIITIDSNDETDVLQANPGTFSELNNVINGNDDFKVYLNRNYTFLKDEDSAFVDGIVISRSMHLYGNGFTIDGANQARIFNASNYVVFHDITFINANSDNGGAIIGSTDSSFLVNNSNFINNHATVSGGAIYNGHADNCVFTNNTADGNGGAIYKGHAENSIFEENSAAVAGAVYDVYAENSKFIRNFATDSCGAMYANSAVNCEFSRNSAKNSAGALGYGHAEYCTFRDNHAEKSGAVENGQIDNSTFINNSASSGGAMSYGDAIGCEFINNSAQEYGGALFNVSAKECYFKSNTAKFGGAISSASVALDSTFIDNIAEVSGGAKFESFTGGCTFEGNLPVYHLYASNLTALEDFGLNVVVNMSDSQNNYLADENITVEIYNSKNVLVKSYSARTGYNSFENLAAGTYRALISANNNFTDVDPIEITITVKKSTFVYAENIIAAYNGGKSVIINLHDSKNSPLKKTKITVRLDGKSKSYTTDKNGQVFISTDGLSIGKHEVIVAYAGTSVYAELTKTITVKVKKANPKLSAPKKTFKKSLKTKKFTVTLKTNQGKVMKGKWVKLTVNKKTYKVKTNSKGQAIFKVTNLKKRGTFKASVRFDGNSYYNARTDSTKIISK